MARLSKNGVINKLIPQKEHLITLLKEYQRIERLSSKNYYIEQQGEYYVLGSKVGIVKVDTLEKINSHLNIRNLQNQVTYDFNISLSINREES